MKEKVVYVDEQGVPTGKVAEKIAAHTANTKLHLAFSCYIFNKQGELLVSRRALHKHVWPGVWTNSVCGHPGPGETLEDAIKRRAQYELGIKLSGLSVVLPKYRYITPPFNGIIENEFCPVFTAEAASTPHPNPEEVADFKWMKWNDFERIALADTSHVWSWWCKDQIKQLSQSQKFKDFLAKW